ncbi:acaloleptin A-like [Zophobas morio]|uniref:acaloleptin A-like n=1 Tax=Zophobas morio TaxID=2755281 RepID=UPI0030832A5C
MLKISTFLLVALVAATSALIPSHEYYFRQNSPYQQHRHQLDLHDEAQSPALIAGEFYRVRRSPQQFEDVYEEYSPEEGYELERVRRSLQPGGAGVPNGPQQNGGWSVNPNLGRDDSGNTRGNVEVSHKGKDHDFNAGWGKVIRGPNKAKPTWHVGGTYRW